MDYSDVWKITLTAIASVGGGGLIVRSMSGYLGKMWADRALERQKQEYAQLNIELQKRLDDASRRLQVELDSLGLIHKLRTQEEFTRLAGLWKRVVNVRNFYAQMAEKTGFRIEFENKEEQNNHDAQMRQQFEKWLNDAQMFLSEEMLFIPKHISDIAAKALVEATKEKFTYMLSASYLETPTIPTSGDSRREMGNIRSEYYKSLKEGFNRFAELTDELENSMREYIAGNKMPA